MPTHGIWCGCELEPLAPGDPFADSRLDLQDLAEVLNLQTHELRRLLERRWLTWEIADEIAVALSRHPFEIWPAWFNTFRRPAGEAFPGQGELDDGRDPENVRTRMSSSERTQRRHSTRLTEGQP